MVPVGIYDKAYQLMRYPLMVTTFAMTPAIQPILTKFSDDKAVIIHEHNRLTGKLLAISLPISVFIYLNSYNIIWVLFGEQWLAIEPLIKIFTFMIPIQAVLSTSGSFFQVMNKPRLLFISGAISALVNVIAIVIGIMAGEMQYVAIALVIAFSINFFQAYFILFKYCFVSSSSDFYIYLCKATGAVLPSILLYYFINYIFLSNYQLPILVSLLANSLVGTISILVFYVLIKRMLSRTSMNS
jgi:PST family polysaccharide transporter